MRNPHDTRIFNGLVVQNRQHSIDITFKNIRAESIALVSVNDSISIVTHTKNFKHTLEHNDPTTI